MRRNGLRFIALSLLTIALLVLGLAVTSWFSASGSGFGILVETNVRLSTAEFCVSTQCIDYAASIPGSEAYAATGVLALVSGVFFALVLSGGLFQRISQGSITAWLRYPGYLLGAATLVLAFACMYIVPPQHITLDFARWAIPLTSEEQAMLVGDLERGFGGLFTVLGATFGLILIRGGAPLPDELPEAEVVAPRDKRAVRRDALVAPPRGVETGPFRAPPAPPPLAVVKNDRPITAPIELDPDGGAPKLLR